MNNKTTTDEFERFPLRYAYIFLQDKGFSEKVDEIRNSRDTYKSYTTTLRRAKIVNFMDSHNLLDEFIENYWAAGKMNKGQNRLNRLRRLYESYSSRADSEEDEAEEEIEGNSFAYEEDLKNYLAANLSVIEPSLRLYQEESGQTGIEYPVDASNKRIDILAVDKNGMPVVIELKVSRGYERVIGQCLYYRNRVRKLLASDKVRIVIIAREITENLKAAVEELPDVELFEYRLSVKLDRVQ